MESGEGRVVGCEVRRRRARGEMTRATYFAWPCPLHVVWLRSERPGQSYLLAARFVSVANCGSVVCKKLILERKGKSSQAKSKKSEVIVCSISSYAPSLSLSLRTLLPSTSLPSSPLLQKRSNRVPTRPPLPSSFTNSFSHSRSHSRSHSLSCY